MKSKKVLFPLFLALLVLAGCDGLIDPVDPGDTSALVISLSQNVSRTLLPDVDMNICEYAVEGTGPGGAAFSETTSDDVLVVEKLAFGSWSIEVRGLNSQGLPIGSGSAEAQVHTGRRTDVSVMVVPYDGFGTLDLTVNWTDGDLEEPEVRALLTGRDGDPVNLDFTVGGGSASFSSSSVATGYYSLALQLLDSGINTMGTVEIVRIVKDALTQGTFNYYEINRPGGTIGVNIDQQMDDPIDVVISGAADSMAAVGSMAVSASAPGETENLQYLWYVNGEFLCAGETALISGLDTGIYNLNLLAFTVDGSRAGSAGVTFRVTEIDYSSYMQIHEIQGAGHTSPYAGQNVTDVVGIVTAKDGKGFWMQSPLPDSDDATSEGILVYVNSAPSVQVGDLVLVDGKVSEYGYSGELKMTEIAYPVIKEVLQTGCRLPDPVVLGNGGRVLPDEIICDDAVSTVYDSLFDPEEDGIDFYESIESMLVQVNDALVVAGDKYGEIPVLADNGANAPAYSLNERGGVTISEDNYNPNLIFIDSDSYILGMPEMEAKTGDRFSAPVLGVVSYSYGKFLVLPTVLPPLIAGSLPRESTLLEGDGTGLTVATFNVENYPRDDDAMTVSDIADKIADIAGSIVQGLNSPDILVLEEITDDSWSTDDGVVAADANFAGLIAAIEAAGGPSTYDFRQIDPLNNDEGGWIGANIRVGFLFNTARVAFEDIGSGDAVTDTEVLDVNGTADISLSPGRISVDSFAGSRRPLIGKFSFAGQTVFVIANHFNSKGGDTALFGDTQPPFLGSEAERLVQAAAINSFVDEILAVQPDANIVVAGDLNDFQFSAPLATLKGGVLRNLTEELLPAAEQYSYSYNGNSQQLDHILVSPALFGPDSQVDIVHRNSEYSAQARHTDHDPVVALLYPGSGDSGNGGSALYFSDYGEGSSNNKYLEVYNGGTGDLVLQEADGTANYFMLLAANGAPLASASVKNFPGGMTIPAGGLIGIYNSSAVDAIKTKMSADVSFASTVTYFNGNDVVALVEDVNRNGTYEEGADVLLDVIGFPGDPADFAKDSGLRRNISVNEGSAAFDPSQWISYPLAEVDAATWYGTR